MAYSYQGVCFSCAWHMPRRQEIPVCNRRSFVCLKKSPDFVCVDTLCCLNSSCEAYSLDSWCAVNNFDNCCAVNDFCSVPSLIRCSCGFLLQFFFVKHFWFNFRWPFLRCQCKFQSKYTSVVHLNEVSTNLKVTIWLTLIFIAKPLLWFQKIRCHNKIKVNITVNCERRDGNNWSYRIALHRSLKLTSTKALHLK